MAFAKSATARVAVFLVLVSLLSARSAPAQYVKKLVRSVGVTASVGVVEATDSDVETGTTFGLALSLAPSSGWGLAGNLGWFSGDLRLNGTKVARAHVRPLMLGAGYTWMRGRLSTTAAVTAGISFNSVDLDTPYRDAFGPGERVSLDVDNSFCVRPSIEVEYALSPKFAVGAWTSYFITSLDSTLTTPPGAVSNHWNPNAMTAAVGVTVYPFR
ncbi:MAG TPA: outer membrane beta-barrel protein [Vicinamibacterales bacterium]